MDISPIPPLYTDFERNTEMIFARLVLTYTRSIHWSEKRESAVFSPSARGFFTKKGRKSRVDTVKQDFLKKVRYCIIFRQKKQGRTIVQNARWWGGDNLSIKGLYLKTLCDLHFLERSCRIKSWAEDASVCKSKPGGDSDFRILMRERSYGEPTDGEDRSAEWSEAIGQAKMMWTFLSKPAQGPIYLPHNPGEIQFDRTLPCCMGGRAPTIARTFVLWYTWRRRHRFRASPTFQ